MTVDQIINELEFLSSKMLTEDLAQVKKIKEHLEKLREELENKQ